VYPGGLSWQFRENDPAPATDITTVDWTPGLRVRARPLRQGSDYRLTACWRSLVGCPELERRRRKHCGPPSTVITPTTKDNILLASLRPLEALVPARRTRASPMPRLPRASCRAERTRSSKSTNWVQNSANGCALARLSKSVGIPLRKYRQDCSKETARPAPPLEGTTSCLKAVIQGIGTPSRRTSARRPSLRLELCVRRPDGTACRAPVVPSTARLSRFWTSGAPGSACNLSDKCSGNNCAIAAGEVGGCCGSCP